LVGLKTVSQLNAEIMRFLLVGQFLNTGILILIVNANLGEHLDENGWLYIVFSRGKYYDYSPEWYADVGKKLIVTMMVQALLPIINVIKTLGWHWWKVFWDTGGKMSHHYTRQSTAEGYKNVYKGSEYLTYIKFSNVLNLVYIAMTYGIGIPVLFPVATIALFINWGCERLLLMKDS